VKATEVFTPGKLPEITYIDDHLIDRARILHDALETGAAVISLSGPSKSGKTVFIEKTIGKDRLIQVTGAGITEANKLWDRVFDLIGTPISKRTTTTNSFDGSSGYFWDVALWQPRLSVSGERRSNHLYADGRA